MQTIRPATTFDVVKLITLGAIWASAFMCIELALVDFSPYSIAAWRIIIASLTLLPIVWLMGLEFPRDLYTWGLLGATGFLYNTIPFTLIGWGQQYISSGTTSLVVACGPFIALLLAHFLTHDDRINTLKFIGVALGFSGVMILVGVEALDGSMQAVFGQLAVVVAVTFYIISSLLIRRIKNVPPLVISTAVLTSSSAYMLPTMFLLGDPMPADPRWSSLAALAYLGLVPTAFAYLLRIQILQQVGTTFLSQVSLIIPIFGLWWGWLFLHEVPSNAVWIALVLVLSGMAVSRWGAKTTTVGGKAAAEGSHSG